MYSVSTSTSGLVHLAEREREREEKEGEGVEDSLYFCDMCSVELLRVLNLRPKGPIIDLYEAIGWHRMDGQPIEQDGDEKFVSKLKLKFKDGAHLFCV